MRLKLVSPKDTLIGHVDVPEHWGEFFRCNGAASAALLSRYRPMAVTEAVADLVMPPEIKQITLAKAGWSQYQDAVYLVRGSVEELETIPGCSFIPSMAYLRSQIG